MIDDTGYDAYQHAQVEARAASADPHQLVLMLVDGLLDELARIEGHLAAGNLERKAESVTRCMDILGGLDTALDLENGGPIAEELHRLYDFCGRQLFDVSVKNDPAGLKVVHQVMSDLREGWQAMAA
ncbi:MULTISPECIES: flagellar export chaperone FliS [Marinobacter]|uniref:Flagellar secretion chaperone FliS n=1 Tax=Marinobacter xestospongiae TaxID=994319 RepID=A0ABU3VWW4_9GAMM|nr:MULTISPECIES: flagellar export chaperone FliS [Marinobacter]MCG8517642.1 flagellar export chaperone FliS [Pseudomonadales bacterium]MDV2078650.1 flagellar export chaperone FliS [Marinobacter xestospongiae]UDL05520.1 flagellar export chaperone FliS [Marinobacter sp. CA1]